MENHFVSFIRLYLVYLDFGNLFRKPFGWRYTIISILNLFIPLFIAIQALWWDCRRKLAGLTAADDDFLAIPVFSHFTQTTGNTQQLRLGFIRTGVTARALAAVANNTRKN